MNNTDILFRILRYTICQNANDDFPKCESEEAERIYALAKKQDLAHLLPTSHTYMSCVSDKITKKIQKSQMLAVFRYEKTNYDYTYICDTFEKNGIDFIPLKGSVIRTLYPEPWMRTSCDIDILVKKDSLTNAIDLLCKNEMFTVSEKHFHDVVLTSKSGVTLELHFTIEENSSKMDRVLQEAWENIAPTERYEKQFTNEFFFFHIIAHAAHHFLRGGCGIRPVLDLWLMKNKMQYDQAILNSLLEKAELSDFAKHLFMLSDAWFSGHEHTETTQNMNDYILGAGIYGNVENMVSLSAGNENKIGYIFQRVFHPFDKLSASYPKLKKYPFLYPYYTLKRWIRIVFGKGRKKAIHEIAYTTSDKSKTKGFDKLRNDLKLDI